MRCVAEREWGASCRALHRLYVALIRSVLDYGCVAYGSAAKSHLKKLDVIQAQALRICCGAFKTSPIPAIQVEMGEVPLELRRKQLMANYWVNLKGHRANHPTREVLQDSWENEKSTREHFAKVGNKIAKELSIEGLQISPPVVFPVEAPWRLVCPRVDMSLLEIKRTGKKTVDLLSAFSHLINQEYQDFVQVYTDGAKNPDTGVTGFGVAVPGKGVGIYRRTGDGLGVYTAEMVAVLVALKWVEITAQKKTVICSDSASVQSINQFYL